MTWLPEGENILMLRLFVLTQSRNVIDKQTVTQTPHDGRPRLYIASRGKKNGTIRKLVYGFLLAFHSNYVSYASFPR